MTLLGLLVLLIVFGLVWWAATKLIKAFAIPDPVATVIIVLIVVIMIMILLSQLGVMPNLRLR